MCQENYFIEQVMRVVRNASNLMTAGITIEQKGNESNYVTSADINVQCYLEEQLTLLIPDSTFLGEESASDIMKSEYMWVVDPIDGTANFIRGLGSSVISVGLVKNGKTYLGVIYDPYKDEMFYAERGKGAFLNGQQIYVSERDFQHSIICSAASQYDKKLATPCLNILQKVFHQVDDFRRFGSAAIEMAYLAAGRIELFFEIRLFPWDMAAGEIIVEEAGGCIEYIYEDSLPLDRPSGIIVSNNKENFRKLKDIVYDVMPYKLY